MNFSRSWRSVGSVYLVRGMKTDMRSHVSSNCKDGGFIFVVFVVISVVVGCDSKRLQIDVLSMSLSKELGMMTRCYSVR